MKLINNWQRHLKSYSFISLVGILLSAISVSGLAALGVLSTSLSFPTLAVMVIIFSIMGGISRFIDQTDDNIPTDDNLEK
ncbi:hypothetical protein D9M71_262720 [compost metagenome]